MPRPLFAPTTVENRHRSRTGVFVLVMLLLIGGGGVAIVSSAVAEPSGALPIGSTPSVSAVSDGGIPIVDIPEYFVSPITRDAYLILKDAAHGADRYCGGGGAAVSPPPG